MWEAGSRDRLGCGRTVCADAFGRRDEVFADDASTRVHGVDRRDTTSLAPGNRVGRYTLLEKLGEGGMGVVYSAWDASLERRVAVKFIRSTETGEARERFVREARAMARVRHPNVVTVFEIGAAAELIFVAMEYIEGGTLRDEVARLRRQSPIPWRRILKLFMAAGRGLEEVHRLGLVHRDFKPDNVLVGRDGTAKVTDFGIVGVAPGDAGTHEQSDANLPPGAGLGTRLTSDGAVLGTPVYMAPEQLRGQPAGPAADQFAFCIALYEALFGELPFDNSDWQRYFTDASEHRVRPMEAPLVPIWVKQALTVGLAPNAAERHAGLPELLAAMDDGADGFSIGSRERQTIALALGVLWGTAPLLIGLVIERIGALVTQFAVDGVMFLSFLAFAIWSWRRLRHFALYNSRILGTVLAVLAAQLVLDVGGVLLGFSWQATRALMILLWSLGAAGVAAGFEWRFWPAAVSYAVAFVCAAAWPGAVFVCMSLSSLFAVANALWMWRDRARQHRVLALRCAWPNGSRPADPCGT